MRVLRGAILDYPSAGKMTLQIPERILGAGANDPSNYEELPDIWFCELRNSVPVTGREEGYLHLTREGWRANEEEILQAFAASDSRYTTEQYQQYALNHFDIVDRKTRNKLRQLLAKVEQLESYLSNG